MKWYLHDVYKLDGYKDTERDPGAAACGGSRMHSSPTADLVDRYGKQTGHILLKGHMILLYLKNHE